MTSILLCGSEEQRQEWLPKLARLEKIGAFGLTEPDTGSDAGNLKTRAVRDGDDWVINGAKMFITNGTWADVCLVFARTGGPGPKGVSAFLVPTATPGFRLESGRRHYSRWQSFQARACGCSPTLPRSWMNF